MSSGPGELGIIRQLMGFAAAQPGGVVEVGIGDDAAVLRLLGDHGPLHAVTTDTLVEGVHFDLRYMGLRELGAKAVAVNMSDIAAMGGQPTLALGTLGIPPGATSAQTDELIAGVREMLENSAAAGPAIALIGGDTFAAPQWTIGFTLIGELAHSPLLRSGAQPGDGVWVSGKLGLSQAGLHRLWKWAQSGALGDPPADETVDRHLRVRPRLALGAWLAEHAVASACMDLSDSLSQCALQLAAASGAGLRLLPSDLELDDDLLRFAGRYSADDGSITIPAEAVPWGIELRYAGMAEMLLASAEDYELLFTVPPALEPQLAGAPGPHLTRIGTVLAGPACEYVSGDGTVHPLTATGYAHL